MVVVDLLPVPQISSSKLIVSSSPGQIGCRVLLVDDSALNRKMMNRLLTRKGYICYEAEDGTNAVDLVAESMLPTSTLSYELIIMDNIMPKLSGPLATTSIRMMGYIGVVIGVTGNALPEDITEFKCHGADAVLSKPLDISDFEMTLRGLNSAGAACISPSSKAGGFLPTVKQGIHPPINE